ncbi:MAG: GspH/FimT family protein [Deltaproteobacteria bacterium]|nr:GspH/FimT family protein [Deltaproteobacteria bacterium]
MMEMMIVIGIIGIAAAIAIPAFMSMLPGMRLNGAARMVASDLMAARMKAVKLNQKTKVFFDNNHQYRICNDADNDGTVGDGEGDVQTRNIQTEYPGVAIDKGAYNDPVFQPRGTASIIIITLNNSEGAQKKVKVHLTGRVMVEDG